MPLSVEPPSPRPPVHWAVRMNRRNRTVFYPLLLLAVGSHLLVTRAPAWAWALLVLNYLVFPQLAYLLAARAADPLRVEKINMDADIVMFGFWSGALGFPLWVAFTLCAAGCINMVVFHGPRGGVRLVVGLVAGVALAALWTPLAWHPDTDLRTSLMCMFALGLYLFAFASDGFRRAMAQHDAHVQLREQFEKIRSLQAQLRDPLTGLFNRRQLNGVLPAALADSHAQAQPLALLLIDIDHFKRINDTHGHATGDAVLQAMADLLLRHAGPRDLACRIGGEEFVLLLNATPPDAAVERAQRLREDFAALRVVAASGVQVQATLSCGVACSPGHANHADALLVRADQALYHAKETGRNRVRCPATAPK